MIPRWRRREFSFKFTAFHRCLVGIIFASFFTCFAVPLGHAAQDDSLLKQYQEARELADSLKIRESDPFHILPRLREISQAVLQDQTQAAKPLLEEVLRDLEIQKKFSPAAESKRTRALWLEGYFELFQKYSILALLAFLLTLIPGLLETCSKNLRLSRRSAIFLIAALMGAGLLEGFRDLLRFGDSAWIIFDVQAVIVLFTAFLAGRGPSLLMLSIFAVLRLSIPSDGIQALSGVAGAGVVILLFDLKKSEIQHWNRTALGAGIFFGALHGAGTFYSSLPWLGWGPFIVLVLTTALLEGAGVWIPAAILRGRIIQSRYQETEKQYLKTRLLFLQSQMNPHFVFNALNTIGAVAARENASDATQLIYRLADFLRNVVRRSEETVRLKEELEAVYAYLDLEQARFGDRLKVTLQQNVSEEAFQCRIPLMILQPLVENAVRHGAAKVESGGRVEIVLREESGQLIAEVSDNGTGIQEETIMAMIQGRHPNPESGQGAGIGLRNIRERLERWYGSGAKLTFSRSKWGGLCVMLQIPLEEKA